ncbi:MAG TPA: M20/M25/M40 family metallo-hydrolase [Chthoniobacterales bacterium]
METSASGERAELSPALKIASWAALVATAAIAIYAVTPPRALDESAAPAQFSAARAKRHLQQIAQEPHAIGTAANQRVRDYLVAQLTALGAEVRVERTVGLTAARRQIYAGTVENIVATIKGTASTRAVMLASHYDSVAEAPGAADAGSGVAAILEAIRALKTGPPLKNDLLIVFTDGEEEGLIGAAGFVRDHPDIAQRVGVVINLEARGSSGPALMFETSEGAGWLTREFARVAPYPFASSLAYTVYKYLPNSTDLTVFKTAGLMGLNFAFSGTFENYHTARDTPDNLDSRSLQQLGANALALARHFGNLELRDVREPDRVYFNWFGSRLVDYPGWVAYVVLALGIAVLIALLVVGSRAGLVGFGGTVLGIVGALGVILAAVLGAHLVWFIVRSTSAERLLVGDTWSNSLIVLGSLAGALAFSIPLQCWLAARLRGYNSVAGHLLVFALLTAAVTYLSPAASYVFQWPLLCSVAAFLAALFVRRSALLLLVGTLPAVLIFAPLGYQLFVVLGLDSISVSVLAVLLALLLALAAPLAPQISRRLTVAVSVLIICACAFTIAGVRISRFTPEHPRRNAIFYSLHPDSGRAVWASYDKAPDDWTRQFLGAQPTRGKAPEFTIGSSREILSADAELLPLEAPTASVLSDAIANGRRFLRLHAGSARRANMLLLRVPAEVSILAAIVNGHRLAISDADVRAAGPWLFRYNAPPPEGVELELELANTAPFTCWFGDRSLGLPELPGKTYPPRPPDMMPVYGSDVILVGRQYSF